MFDKYEMIIESNSRYQENMLVFLINSLWLLDGGDNVIILFWF